MTLREAGYRERLVDPVIDRLLPVVGAVSVEGPRWCGKTWTSLAHANSVFFLTDPAGGFRNRELAQLDPLAALAGDPPHAVDEWQEVPGIWDAVRHEVDRGSGRGRYLLTGSSVPADDATAHSGIGRIARLRIRPMTLAESGDSTGEVSLGALRNGNSPSAAPGRLTVARVTELVIRGGWPASLDLTVAQAGEVAQLYMDGLARADASRIDSVRRDPGKVASLLASLARNSATTVTNATILRDIQSADETISSTTLAEYLSILQRLYVLEQIPAWEPALRSPVRLRQAPKRLLVDPSLAAAGIRATPATLAAEPKTLGFLFETMILRDLLVFADLYGGRLYHYRDSTGLEADAILTWPDGEWAAIEIKLGHTQTDKAAAALTRLSNKMVQGGHKAPVLLLAIVGVGSYTHRRDDGVYVVPADLLGP